MLRKRRCSKLMEMMFRVSIAALSLHLQDDGMGLGRHQISDSTYSLSSRRRFPEIRKREMGRVRPTLTPENAAQARERSEKCGIGSRGATLQGLTPARSK